MKNQKQKTIELALLRAYDSHADAIYRHCYYRLFNKDSAEDFTQEIFVRLFEYLNEGNEIRFIKSFLYKTANNLIIDYVRKKKEASLEFMVQNGFDLRDQGEINIEDSIDADIILTYLEQIEPEFREALFMRYVDGLKPKEISEILCISQNIVSVRIYRGLKKLKELIPQ